MGKLTISMAIFHSYVTNYQRVGDFCWLLSAEEIDEVPRPKKTLGAEDVPEVVQGTFPQGLPQQPQVGL